jgi:BolA family transcriptional regulator, general stress-responsive regulator
MTTATRAERIRSQLQRELHTEQVELTDDSHLHVGHAGARDGRGHFRVRVVSEDFAGLTTLQRHQLVYRALGELMKTDIHALGITALTPGDARTPSPRGDR